MTSPHSASPATQVAARVLLAAALAACGGGSEPGTTGPGNTPAALIISAGDNQEAAPGTLLPISPSVLVKDAQGSAVAGVTVTFTVVSGGGALQERSAVTNASGIAAAGGWTLGPDEGQQTLKANVPSLPDLLFHATATSTSILANAVIPAAGGAINVQAPGNPLNGLSITVPSGAYAVPTHWTVEAKPIVAVPLPAGVSLAAPVMRIRNGQGMADAAMKLRIPVAHQSTKFTSAFYFDPTSATLEVMPLVARDAASITVAVRHFNAGYLLRSSPAASSRRSAVNPAIEGAADEVLFGEVYVVALSSDFVRLLEPLSTEFVPGEDDWEFPNRGSYIAPDGQCSGQSITALWYFYAKRAGSGALYHKYDRVLPDLWHDNPNGYRLASMAQFEMDWTGAQDLMLHLFETAGPEFSWDELQYFAVALGILVTSQPQFLAIRQSAGPHAHALIAYGAEGGRLLIADPNYPAVARELRLVNHDFIPYNGKETADAEPDLFDRFLVVGVTAMLPLWKLEGLWLLFQTGLIGDATFPAMQLQALQPDGLWEDVSEPLMTTMEEIRLRVLCPSCPFTNPAPGSAAKMQFVGVSDAAGQPLGTVRDGQGSAFSLPNGSHTVGAILWAAPRDPQGAETPWKYNAFRWMTIESAPFVVEPNPASVGIGLPITLVSRPWGKAPAQARYVWKFNDNTAPVTVPGDSAVSHTFTTSGTFTVDVDLINQQTGRVHGRTRAVVVVDPAVTFVRVSTAVGGSHTCGITPNDDAWCWGKNTRGQLGDGSTTRRTRAVKVLGNVKFAQISAGGLHTCALTPAGVAWCWGDHTWAQRGDGSPYGPQYPVATQPVRVQGAPALVSISAANNTTCGRTATGETWCWGWNVHGQVGDGTALNQIAAVRVLTGSTAGQVSVGYWQTCATTQPAGTTWCWGDNGKDLDGLYSVDYSPQAWGAGILGTGSQLSRIPQPMAVIAPGQQWDGVAVGNGFICAHVASGPASCWGLNGYGQLGDQTTQWRSTPAPVSLGLSFTAMGAGGVHACGLTTAGDVYCWGGNAGQVGDGTTTHRSTPVPIASTAGPFVRLSVGSASTCAIAQAGSTWCWGFNGEGALGDGTLISRSTPVRIAP